MGKNSVIMVMGFVGTFELCRQILDIYCSFTGVWWGFFSPFKKNSPKQKRRKPLTSELMENKYRTFSKILNSFIDKYLTSWIISLKNYAIWLIFECARAKMARKLWDLLHRSCWVLGFQYCAPLLGWRYLYSWPTIFVQ